MADPSTASAGEVPASGGLPQFDLAQWPGQIVWVLVVFAVLYLLIAKVFVPSVGGAIEAREKKISGDIAEARRLKQAAEDKAKEAALEMDAARERARKVAADAKQEAKTAAARRRAEEAGRLAKGFADAEARIAAAKGEAMSHVRAIAATTALAMIERLTGRSVEGSEIETALGAGAAPPAQA